MGKLMVVLNKKTMSMVGRPTTEAYAKYVVEFLNKVKPNNFVALTQEEFNDIRKWILDSKVLESFGKSR